LTDQRRNKEEKNKNQPGGGYKSRFQQSTKRGEKCNEFNTRVTKKRTKWEFQEGNQKNNRKGDESE